LARRARCGGRTLNGDRNRSHLQPPVGRVVFPRSPIQMPYGSLFHRPGGTLLPPLLPGPGFPAFQSARQAADIRRTNQKSACGQHAYSSSSRSSHPPQRRGDQDISTTSSGRDRRGDTTASAALRAGTRPCLAHPIGRQHLRTVKLPQPLADRVLRDPGRTRHRRDPSAPMRSRLSRDPPPPLTLIKRPAIARKRSPIARSSIAAPVIPHHEHYSFTLLRHGS
jgi:hypothetical protein